MIPFTRPGFFPSITHETVPNFLPIFIKKTSPVLPVIQSEFPPLAKRIGFPPYYRLSIISFLTHTERFSPLIMHKIPPPSNTPKNLSLPHSQSHRHTIPGSFPLSLFVSSMLSPILLFLFFYLSVLVSHNL